MLPDRFWKHVDKTASVDGCWLWTGCKVKGYGAFKLYGKIAYAHRLVGIETFGEAACVDKCVCHSCDVRECVNPEHLFVGTHLDNARDRDAKNRQAAYTRWGFTKPPVLRGEDNRMAKLSEKQVLEIRKLYKPPVVGGMCSNARELAEKFHVSKSHIYLIASGKSWKHL